MLGLFKRDTKPATPRLKMHDVEARLHDVGGKNMSGKVWQTRWSDGTGKFRIMLPKIRAGWTQGTTEARLKVGGAEAGSFALRGRGLDFKWSGKVSEVMPLLEIGQQMRLELGDLAFEGTIEAD